MFKGSVFNEPINHWDVSTVTNMSSMFDSSFNQPLNDWVVGMLKIWKICLLIVIMKSDK